MFIINVWQWISSNVGWSSLFLIIILGIVSYIYVNSNLPPGPMGLPFIGFYPFIENNPHVQFSQLAKKYGDIFSFSVMGQRYIHLNTIKMIKEAHVTKSDCFESRPEKFSIFAYVFGGGVGFLNGPAWKELRKFFLSTLKEFGMGKMTLETHIHDAVQQTLDALKKSDGKPHDVLPVLDVSCTSVITQLFFSGKAGGIHDQEIRNLNNNYQKIVDEVLNIGAKQLLCGTLFKYLIFPFMSGHKVLTKAKFAVHSVLQEIIDKHKKTFEKNSLRNFVDFFLEEKRKLQEKGDERANYYTDDALKSSLLQMFGDGGLSIGMVLYFLLRTLMDQPDAQKGIQKELDEVVGKERLPSWTDRTKLPYTEATIMEYCRTTDFFPFSISLQCSRETTIQGYRIPKGTITVVNSWSAQHDPTIYSNPQKFDPGRFLGPDGKRNKLEPSIVFGVGKRSCPGESLSSMEIFLFLTSILQKYTIEHPKDRQLEEVAAEQTSKYELCAVPRNIQ